MGKKRIVLDTNVLISAFGWVGVPRTLFGLVLEGKALLFASPETFSEFCRVADYPKFRFSANEKARFKNLLISTATMVFPSKKFHAIQKDPSDNIFLDCAFACNADFLITGDKHLLALKKFHKTKIITPDALCKFLETEPPDCPKNL